VLKVVQFLQFNPKRIVRIEGYTDSTGDSQENLELSRDRAQAVADVLADLGIEDERIQVQGYGDLFAVDSNTSERGRAQNRRVEIVFSDEKGLLSAPR
jgi:outer membrane protein OmpA-like peptidoglycan-associated protein